MNQETLESMEIASNWAQVMPLETDRQSVFECPKCGGEMLIKQEKKYGHLSCQCLSNGCVAWIS